AMGPDEPRVPGSNLKQSCGNKMPDDLDALLNGFLDGRLTPAQSARLDLRLKRPAVARRLTRLQALRGRLRAALPQPSGEQSGRMWEAVRSRCVEASPEQVTQPIQVSEGWFTWLSRPWVPAWGLGLGATAAAVALAFLFYPRWSAAPEASVPASATAFAPSASPVRSKASPSRREHTDAAILALAAEEAPRRIQRRNVASRARRAEALASALGVPHNVLKPEAASVAAIPILAGLPVQSPPALGPGATEVERALADNQDDALVSRFLSMQPAPQVPVIAMFAPSARREGGVQAGAENTVAYQPESAPTLQPAGSGVPGPVQGGKDGDGYWNWVPAAQAMNQRDWAQARVELLAAAGKAGSAAERDFAHSALYLLAASGGPLEGSQSLLPSTADLRVLGAGTWQLLVDSRLARFGQGVALRLPGLRVDGDSFLLDLVFNRGEFSPGSHYERVIGEPPAQVLYASGQPVSDNDFYAPSGADYDLQAKVLRLR
ncbi:MAG: hypothetical protein ACREKE_00045, partial [bacterium]